MAQAIVRNSRIFGVDKIYRIARARPGIDKVFTKKRFAHVFRRTWIVDDRIAIFSEPDQHHEMSIRAGPLAPQTSIVERYPHRNIVRNPGLELSHTAESRNVGTHSRKAAGVVHIQ